MYTTESIEINLLQSCHSQSLQPAQITATHSRVYEKEEGDFTKTAKITAWSS